MTFLEEGPLHDRLLQVGLALESIEQGWTAFRSPEVRFHLEVVLPNIIESLRRFARPSRWISEPLGEIERLLAEAPHDLASPLVQAQLRLHAKTLKCGVLAAFMKFKYNDFCDTESIFLTLWELDNIRNCDERNLLTHNTFLHFEANAHKSKRSWSCPPRTASKGDALDKAPSNSHITKAQIVVDPSAWASKPQRLAIPSGSSKAATQLEGRGRWADESSYVDVDVDIDVDDQDDGDTTSADPSCRHTSKDTGPPNASWTDQSNSFGDGDGDGDGDGCVDVDVDDSSEDLLGIIEICTGDGSSDGSPELFGKCLPSTRDISQATTTASSGLSPRKNWAATSGPAHAGHRSTGGPEDVAEHRQKFQKSQGSPNSQISPSTQNVQSGKRSNRVIAPRDGRWWVQLPDICPISKFPVSRLPYPPFRLHNRSIFSKSANSKTNLNFDSKGNFGTRSNSNSCSSSNFDSDSKPHSDSDVLVDGLIVVLQVIKTMRFSVLGKELTAGEIRALDYHVKHCKLSPLQLQHVLLLAEGAKASEEKRLQLEEIRSKAGQKLRQLQTLQGHRKKRQSCARV